MGKIKIKPVVNRRNGQMNFSLPKKKLPPILKANPDKLKSIKLDWEDFEIEW